MKKILFSFFFFLFSFFSFSQEQIDMADELRSSGKIYVVVAVLCVIFIGIMIYIFRIDRKISKLEKDKKN